ncbi:MAG: hypothetical protein BGO41_05280 [Clostridiales bacterium 38-18]|nr:MAG: hypothetical protein BGO41_05280 [Clostridiales bacterium 38-18]
MTSANKGLNKTNNKLRLNKVDFLTIAIQMFYWMLFCSVYGYATYYMKQSGHSSGSIGLIVAAGSIISVMIQPWLGTLSDKGGVKRLKEIILIVLGMGAVLMLGVTVLQSSLLIITVLYIFTISLLLSLQPLINSYVIAALAIDGNLNFGITRAFGSMSFAIQSSILGTLVGLFSKQMVPLNAMIYFIITGLSIVFLPVRAQSIHETEEEMKIDQGAIAFLKRYSGFTLILLGVSLIYAFHTICNVYLIQIIQNVNGNEMQFGRAMTVAALSELPTMLGFGLLLKRFKSGTLFMVSGVFFVMKSILFLTATSVQMIYMAQLMQIVSFALYVPASVSYIHDRMQSRDKVKGQSYLIASTTFGGVIASIGGGVIIELFSVKAMLMGGLILALTGAALLIFGILKDSSKKTLKFSPSEVK